MSLWNNFLRQTADISCQIKVNFYFPTFGPCFEEGCKENNIELYVLPPRSPKYNGRIERFNRIVRDELLSKRDLLNTINSRGDYNIILQEFINNYNNKRPHSSIDYLSPMEYSEREKEKRFLSQAGWTYTIMKKHIDFLIKYFKIQLTIKKQRW